MKFKHFVGLLLTSTLLLSGLYAQTTLLSLTSSGTNAASQTWTNTYCQPVTVRITVKGGGGGGGSYKGTNSPIFTDKGSTGATMIGEFTVPAGHVLRAVAGGAGETGSIPNLPNLVFAGGGGGAGSGVVNATTSTLLILAAGGTGADSSDPGIGASAATDGNGSGGSAGMWSTGGGGLNGPGASDGRNGCPDSGGRQVSLTGISQGARNCSSYSYAGDGGNGMGGGGGASDLGGGGGGHTGGSGGNDRSAAKSYNTGANQVNTNGSDNTDPNPGTVLIQLLTDVSNVPPDVTPPTVTCKNHTVALSASNNTASVVPTDVHQNSSDACGPVTLISVTPNSFNCTHVGTQSVTLTVRDASNNTSTCTATVTVEDNIQPQISCKNTTVTLGANNSASIAPADVFQSGSDNCGTVQLISVSPNTFDCSDIGPNTVFLMATDGNGNFSNCSRIVNVRDATPPTVTCKNHTVSFSAAGTASIAPSDVFQSGSDNCGTVSPASVSPNSFNCTNLGQNTVTLTVNDGNGNTATCTATITVQDNIPLSVTCKNHTAVLSAAGTASIVPTNVFQSGSDNCGTVNLVSVVPNSFNCTNLGQSTVTLTVNDGNSNTATCTATITVQDNTPPQVTCKNHTVALSAAGTASVAPTNVFQSGSDNCGTVNLVSVVPNLFICTNIGPNTVTLSVNDGNSNINTCTATITVQDNTPPSVTCKNHTAVLSAAGTASIVLANVFQSGSDNCGTVNPASVSPNSFTCANLGQNTVTLTVNDGNGNTNTCTATVTVQDNTPPQPVCKNHAVVLDQNGSASITPADVFQSGTDNCGTVNLVSAAPNSFACTQVGPVTVTLTVNDDNSNTATCTASVTVSDNQPPIITCPASIALNTDPNQCSAMVTYASPTFSDNCTAILVRTGGLASGSAFPMGTNMVEWKVTDPGNNTAICQFSVKVTDAQPPTITCPASLVYSADAGQCSAVVTYTLPSFSDNCTGAFQVLIGGQASGTVFQKGTNTVIWKATDGAGLTATCAFTVTVSDGQQPSIICPGNVTKGTDVGLCSAIVNYTAPTASDNCSGVISAHQSGGTSGSVFPKGQTTVVWRATDAAGLTRTCSFRVTVNDTEAPVITCPGNQSANTAPSSCTANVTYPTPTATDNCPGAITVVRVSGPASGGSFPQGSTNVTWRAIDAAGRSSTCSFSVTVADATPPVVTCPGNIAVTGGGNPCTAVAAYATPTSTDNCGVQSVFLLSGQPSGSSFPAGATVNTWRAVDNAGLSHSCSFTVTVGCGANSEEGAASRERSAPETSVDALQALSFSLAPNPAQDEVRVSIENLGTTGGELVVYDAQSRLMWQQRVESSVVSRQSSAVSLTDFPAGVYFVTLRTEGQMVTKRLVVARN